jgi:phosphoribosylanthranilate isomerase
MWIKVCGLTSEAAVAAALEAEVSAIGFVFARSPRAVTPTRAAQLARAARGNATIIAVTLQPAMTFVEEIFEVLCPDLLQIDWTDLSSVPARHQEQVLPVLRQGQTPMTPLSSRLLFEGPKSGVGMTADWSAAAVWARDCELILAGGLSADNVATAIRTVRPFGVDVSSGVETAPGEKSASKIKEFVNAARAAAAELAR